MGRLGDVVIAFENEQYLFMERGTEKVDPERPLLRHIIDGVKISGAPNVADNKETFGSDQEEGAVIDSDN